MASAPPVQPAAAPRKKSPWIWVAAGCGGVILVVMIVLAIVIGVVGKKVRSFAEEAKKNPAVAAVKLAIAFNPDLELVKADNAAGTITIRNKKTGEVLTVDMAEAKQGRIRFRNEKGEEVTLEGHGEGGEGSFRVKSKEGEVAFGSGTQPTLPTWVPMYPGAKPTGSVSQHKAEGSSGSYMFTTSDSTDAIIGYFEKKLTSEGFKVETMSAKGMPTSVANLNAKADDGRREVNVTAVPVSGAVQVTVEYQGPEA
jgi:Na+-transporting methylmalonyl-CoA/oxaloacetate decarboxylase gamma subunit